MFFLHGGQDNTDKHRYSNANQYIVDPQQHSPCRLCRSETTDNPEPSLVDRWQVIECCDRGDQARTSAMRVLPKGIARGTSLVCGSTKNNRKQALPESAHLDLRHLPVQGAETLSELPSSAPLVAVQARSGPSLLCLSAATDLCTSRLQDHHPALARGRRHV